MPAEWDIPDTLAAFFIVTWFTSKQGINPKPSHTMADYYYAMIASDDDNSDDRVWNLPCHTKLLRYKLSLIMMHLPYYSHDKERDH